jgi:hypothetical protein
MNIEDFGSDCYSYVPGAADRLQVGRVRTLLPGPHESNEAFELRMDLLCRQLLGMSGIAQVTLQLERVSGALVRATVTIAEEPRTAPIAGDLRGAGGRFDRARGARGSRRPAPLVQLR